MSETCIFCRIFRGEIPAQEVRRTADALVFRDTSPHAPTHLLVIPKRHVSDLGDFVEQASAEEVGDFLKVVGEAGRSETTRGYRVVSNVLIVIWTLLCDKIFGSALSKRCC